MDLMTAWLFVRRYWKPVAVLALAAAVYAWGWSNGRQGVTDRYERKIANLQKTQATERELAQVRARQAEQRVAEAVNQAAAEYERGKRDAESKAAAVVADLRAGNLRLRNRWEGCQATAGVSGAVAAAGQPDADAADRAESAGRIVRAAAECDAQVNGLQQVIREYRGE